MLHLRKFDLETTYTRSNRIRSSQLTKAPVSSRTESAGVHNRSSDTHQQERHIHGSLRKYQIVVLNLSTMGVTHSYQGFAWDGIIPSHGTIFLSHPISRGALIHITMIRRQHHLSMLLSPTYHIDQSLLKIPLICPMHPTVMGTTE
jgi:hypothetical protein